MTKSLTILAISLAALLEGCAKPDLGPPQPTPQITTTEPITLKGFRTGVPASDDLKMAARDTKSWSYFGEPRTISLETRSDGVVTEIKFNLRSSWEGYELRNELEKKLKWKTSGGVHFKCASAKDRLEFLDKSFAVSDEYCYAFDDSQTLVIHRRWPRYVEPIFEVYPSLKGLVDNGYVRLYNDNEKTLKAAEERRELKQRIDEQDKKAADDI